WMSMALRLIGAVTVLSGLAMVGLYHECFRLVGMVKPLHVWPLQALGSVNILIGVGYFLAARNLRRSRWFLTLAFAFQASLELWLTFVAANQRLKVNLPIFVLAVALCYLLPLAIIIFAIVGDQRSKAGVRFSDKKSSSHWIRKGAVWTAWAAMLIAILL